VSAAAGHEVMLSNSRGPETLADVVGSIAETVRAGTVPEAARFGEIVAVAIPIAGDDAGAKQTVSDLIDQIGFTAVDAGTLADSRRQKPGSPVFLTFADSRREHKILTAERLRELLAVS
jgi:predicted dinucleotide-binding enzyme